MGTHISGAKAEKMAKEFSNTNMECCYTFENGIKRQGERNYRYKVILQKAVDMIENRIEFHGNLIGNVIVLEELKNKNSEIYKTIQSTAIKRTRSTIAAIDVSIEKSKKERIAKGLPTDDLILLNPNKNSIDNVIIKFYDQLLEKAVQCYENKIQKVNACKSNNIDQNIGEDR